MQLRNANLVIGLSALAGLALASAPASAAITGTTGQAIQIGPPVNCNFGFLNGNTAYAWDEQQNRGYAGIADMVNNPGISSAPVAGAVGGVYDSHFIHFEDYSGLPPVNGTVSFNNPIVAVFFITTTLSLDFTDAPLGALGTLYPTGYPFRGLNAQSSFSINANTLSFNFATLSPVPEVVQVRVLTQVPSAGAGALLGLSGCLALTRRRRPV
jgi:hypothetical protein